MPILIVEDNETSAKIMELTLQRNKHETVRAGNGREALGKLKSHLNIQLVITDIMMPEMDGLALLKALKKAPEYTDIPVIMTTAMANAETVKKAATLGCKHYLVKPFQPVALLRRVQEALQSENPVIKDKLKIMNQLDLDEEAYKEIEDGFRQMLQGEITALEFETNKPASGGGTLALKNLLESANSFGAERLINALEEAGLGGSTDQPVDWKTKAPSLLREIKLVLKSLPSSPPEASQPKEGKKQKSKPK